jgi:rubrerythrin
MASRSHASEMRSKFSIYKDMLQNTLVYACDSCDFSEESEKSIFICPKCGEETRVQPRRR